MLHLYRSLPKSCCIWNCFNCPRARPPWQSFLIPMPRNLSHQLPEPTAALTQAITFVPQELLQLGSIKLLCASGRTGASYAQNPFARSEMLCFLCAKSVNYSCFGSRILSLWTPLGMSIMHFWGFPPPLQMPLPFWILSPFLGDVATMLSVETSPSFWKSPCCYGFPLSIFQFAKIPFLLYVTPL